MTPGDISGADGATMTEVTFGSLDELQNAIKSLTGAQMNKLGEKAGFKIAQELRTIMRDKPGRSNSPVIWPSERARRAYFARRREDGLDPKYTRNNDPWSEKSGQRWIARKIAGGALLGNPATYAPYVFSHQHQSAQHKATGWTTDKEAADRVFDDGTVGRVVQAELERIIRWAFRGL